MKANRLKTNIKQVLFVFLLSVLISTLLFVFMVDVDKYVYRSDFVSFINGAYIVGSGRGEDLYNLELQRESQLMVTTPSNRMVLLPYRNPPILALLFTPLTLVSLVFAYKVYTLILIVTTLFIIWFSRELFKNLKDSFWLVLPFVFYPSIVAIFAGQVSIFILLIFLLIYYFLKKQKAMFLGAVTGFLLLKPQYIISLPFIFILTNNKANYLKGFSVSSFLILVVSVLISGFSLIGDYFQMLVQTENMISEVKTSMFTIFFTLSQTALQKNYVLLINALMYLVAIYYFYRNYKRIKLDINYCIVILLTLVFCIHGVIVDMAVILLPIWILLDNVKRRREIDVINIIVIFILIISPLGYILKIPYVIAFLFLLSVALLFRTTNFGFLRK